MSSSASLINAFPNHEEISETKYEADDKEQLRAPSQEINQQPSHHHQYYQHIHQIRPSHQVSNQTNRAQTIKTLLSASNNLNTIEQSNLQSSPSSDSSSTSTNLNSIGSSSSKSICNQKKKLSKKLSTLFQNNNESYNHAIGPTSTVEIKSEVFDAQFDEYSSNNEQPTSSPIEKYEKFSVDENQDEDNEDNNINNGK
jgi:hypothetical protein